MDFEKLIEETEELQKEVQQKYQQWEKTRIGDKEQLKYNRFYYLYLHQTYEKLLDALYLARHFIKE